MDKQNWSVLLVGGSSGIGKTRLTKELAKIYKAKVIKADDVCDVVKAVTTADAYPAIHYWISDIDWTSISVTENVDKLYEVSSELRHGIKAIIDNHIENDFPVIIEGDFISAECAASFNDPKVQAVFIYEPAQTQIMRNYLDREGGEPQAFRASISAEYGNRLKMDCDRCGVNIVESRPWNTLVDRVIECITIE